MKRHFSSNGSAEKSSNLNKQMSPGRMSSSEKLSRREPDQTMQEPEDEESDTSEDVEAMEMNRFKSHYGEEKLRTKGRPDISELSSIRSGDRRSSPKASKKEFDSAAEIFVSDPAEAKSSVHSSKHRD